MKTVAKKNLNATAYSCTRIFIVISIRRNLSSCSYLLLFFAPLPPFLAVPLAGFTFGWLITLGVGASIGASVGASVGARLE